MTWYKNLMRNSIDLWEDICHEFTAYLIVSRTQPKTVVSLKAIMQGKNEPLRDYIERIHKEVVQVRGADEIMKLYLIKKGLRPDTDMKKVVQLDHPRSLNKFLAISKTYIMYDEQLYNLNLNKSRKQDPAAESSEKPFQEKNVTPSLII